MKTQRLFIGVLVLCILLILTATAGLAQGPTPTTGGNPNPPGGGKPITSVKAGAGLIGGGTSGEVTLAISTTFQLPQACANGQVAKWNGTTWVCANDGLTLPFAGSANSSSDLISVTNTERTRRVFQDLQHSQQQQCATGRDERFLSGTWCVPDGDGSCRTLCNL